MATQGAPLLVKRYVSRRLYNTETSDYVTLDDIAGFIREGRDVQIIDLKSGHDLTRQYLLQIIAEHESRGESMLPIGVLNDLVRSYSNQANTVMPQFLQMSFDMLRDGQSKMVENLNATNTHAIVPGFDAMQAQQESFLKAMTSGLAADGWSDPDNGADSGSTTETDTGFKFGTNAQTKPQPAKVSAAAQNDTVDDLNDIKRQLSELQSKLKNMSS
ncbi:MAG: polyhydroxyalkanoate synthesis repressor PhaR [Paracoccaceae bacterium]|nr:polyhydroxyalkanoate synthesis repressor PhaR [Paracoccaceae bacterium]